MLVRYQVKFFISDITAKIDSTSKPVSYYYTPTEELDYECEYEVFSSADFNYNEIEIDVNGSVDEFKGETKQFIKVMYDSN